MRVAILAGGFGLRLLEETAVRPKALVEIGAQPIIWHIMRYFSHFGFKHFAIALGYKKELVRAYMAGCGLKSDGQLESALANKVSIKNGEGTAWTVELIDTGDATETGGRIKRLAPFLGNEPFVLAYCDGLADINLHDLLAHHRSHKKLATVMAVHPPSRFGYLELQGDRVQTFSEKPQILDKWINGSFFVLEPGVFDYIEGDTTVWEREPLERLAKEGQLMAYRHTSFWQCMDTVHDRRILENLWQSGQAPWKVWE